MYIKIQEAYRIPNIHGQKELLHVTYSQNVKITEQTKNI
jgi:hypothetical protein